MNTPKKVLAVELPAPCSFNCSFCRTPNHDQGDPEKLLSEVQARLNSGGYEELYLTSNGETGLSAYFEPLVSIAISRGIKVSVLCASESSVVSGLSRAEISYNHSTKKSAEHAIKKANSLGIPVVLLMIDCQSDENVLASLQNQLPFDGILIRALQAEEKSNNSSAGTSWFEKRNEVNLGCFPVAAYRELSDIGVAADCLNSYGQKVKFLGSPS